ncbi:subunit 5 of transcription initiation factor TFIID [Chloropicon primus]|uniref:Subunit 5 of transcription initiation factor TFIID n=1 Tax=Chloropicon primus TaxID=1764295 RepID=A0A5B8MI45_9CHLO|nr:subunit 5 of transcription initiation factor TFIID [Chloropicon primus]UPQ99335.1 subunit 5 of transcription initiation factor TFIID [Chloropicon primus]|eukprot:QDZ20123.1 subunit 5 of transcription initiation factor TFIID [Chloropicon primus]
MTTLKNDSGASDLDWVVIQYLHKNSCFDAEKSFLKHLATKQGVDVIPPKQVLQDDYLKYLVMSKLFPESVDGVRNYTMSYQELYKFVTGLIDIYREDLQRLLYPIFIYCLLDLIYLQKTVEFKDFFDTNCSLIEELAVPGRVEELDQLRKLRSEQDIDHNPVASKFWHSRAAVGLSEQSFDLLTRFLHDHKHYNILRILHERLNIEFYPGIPVKTKLEPISIEDAIPMSIKEEATAANTEVIQLGLLPDTLEDKVVMTAEDMEKATKEDKEGIKESSSSKKTKRTKMLFLGNDKRIKKAIPLATWADEIADKFKRDISNRERLNRERLPSICCATFLNTHRMTTACHMLANEVDIAAGFGDSSIQLRSLKPSEGEDDVDGMEEDDEDLGNATVPPGQAVELLGHSGPITALSSSLDETFLLSASCDASVRLWSLELKRCLVSFKSHSGPVWDVAVCPRSPYFATGGWDGTARVWSTEHSKPLRLLVGHMSDVDSVAWHPNAHYVATGSSDCTVRLWDVATGKAVRVLTGGHKHKVSSVAVSPNGKLAASGAVDGSVAVWDLGESKLLGQFSTGGSIWSLDFDRYGSMLASGDANGVVGLWDAGSAIPSPLASYETKDTPVYNVHFSRTNLLFAMAEFSNNP